MPRSSRGEKAAGKNAGRASQQIGGDGGGRDRQRNILGGIESGTDKCLDSDRRYGQRAEVGKAKQDRLLTKKLGAVSQRVPWEIGAMSAAAEHAALCWEGRGRKEARRAHRPPRGWPATE